MLINGKRITNIYKYSDEYYFTKGDFIVSDKGVLYVCILDADPGTSLSDGSHFKVYLGNQTASFSDFSEYLKNPGEGNDLYINMHTLSEILQRMYFGLSDTGVISGYFRSFSETSLSDLDSTKSPLDAIMTAPELNNGIIRITRDLVGGLLSGELVETGKYNFFKDAILPDSSDDDYLSIRDIVILKQYTYGNKSSETGETIRGRVQEIVDPIFGTTYYRSSYGSLVDSEWNYGKTTQWKASLVGEDIVEKQLSALQNQYDSLKKTYDSNLSALSSKFKFTKVTSGSAFSVKDSAATIVTVSVRRDIGGEVYEYKSVTFSLSEVAAGAPLKISLPGGNSVKVEISNDNTVTITPVGSDWEISNIYYQENYV